MDPAGESYLRQEGRGLCIGFYEQPCRPWAVDGTPWSFGHELLPDDFDKIEDSIAFAYRRFPVLETAGVKTVIHGPFTFAPDGNPLVGPVPGPAQLLVGLRRHGGLFAGRRRRADAGAMDGRMANANVTPPRWMSPASATGSRPATRCRK